MATRVTGRDVILHDRPRAAYRFSRPVQFCTSVIGGTISSVGARAVVQSNPYGSAISWLGVTPESSFATGFTPGRTGASLRAASALFSAGRSMGQHGVEIHVPAAEDDARAQPARGDHLIEQRGRGHGAGRLHHDLHPVPEEEGRGHDGVVADR